MSEETTTTPERERITMVYMGQRWDTNDKTISYEWQRTEPVNGTPELVDRPRIWKKVLEPGANIGGMYEFYGKLDENEKLTIYNGKGSPVEYKGRFAFHDDQRLMDWHAQNRAATTQQTLERNKKKDGLYDPIDEALKPIRAAMQKTNYAGRQAILAYIINRLLNG